MYRSGNTWLALAMLVSASACVDRGAPDDPGGQCELGVVHSAVQAADRKILGAGAPYAADATLRGQDEALAASQRLRRELGWRTAAKVLTPVELNLSLPSLPGGVPARLPAWQTWYAKDDLSRVFARLYEALDADARHARARFGDLAIDGAFAWNVDAVDGLENWPKERFDAYLAGIDDAARAAGTGGIGRVGYSPAAARQLLDGYPELVSCLANGAPAPFVDGPAEGSRRLVREDVALGACAARRYGPYFVAGGETLHATLVDAGVHGKYGALGATIAVRDAAGASVCSAGTNLACEIAGPGAFEIVVSAGTTAARAALTVDYAAPTPEWAACLSGAFPVDAVVVKADWRRVLPSMPLAVYDTSAAGLARRRSAAGKFAWGLGDGVADPGEDDIYTVRLDNGNVYRLAALHIMTKELDHWLWVTLWWSPADHADEDFGADRPAALRALGGPWSHYKMCAVTAFDERDTQAGGGYDEDAPSLAAALAAVSGGVGAPSWCSNPYLELGDGNADTNCVGCHQHAGTRKLAEDILADEQLFPAHGRQQVRNNFPADYSWAGDHGDELARLFTDIVEYWDHAP